MQNKTDLVDLGWHPSWDDLTDSVYAANAKFARVVGEERGLYRIQFSKAQEAHAIITGKFRHQAKGREGLPAVGDWISCEKPIGSEQWLVTSILPRKSCLSRKVAGETSREQIIATNIDYVLIASSCNQNFNTARIERYLALALNSGAKPVVILTKSDLATSKESYTNALKGISDDLEFIFVSAHQNEGLDKVRSYFLPNNTNVIVGSSGVGKSSLINALIGEDVLKTQEVRDEDGKGKHTTTARYLLHLPFGGMIIDTPGMREVQVLDIEEGMGAQFADIENIQIACKFSDCQHKTEPGCAIKAALASGELTEGHWKSYLKLKQEVEEVQGRSDRKSASDKNKIWRKRLQEDNEKPRAKGKGKSKGKKQG